AKSTSSDRMAVCMADGRMLHGGLADGLRSYVSYYGFCKELGLRLAINFTSPFRLEDYLVPNRYDWTLKPGELTYNSSQAEPLFFKSSGAMTAMERKFQLKLVNKYLLGKKYIQHHLYSNFSFGEDKFGEYFNELFKPSERIAAIVERCKSELGAGYISISTRFLELLGDFKEPKNKRVLSPQEQCSLIDECRGIVERLHSENPDVKILLTSDSQRFLDSCKNLEYIYTPEGEIAHVDIKEECDHTKTIVDFLLIAGASRVYQIKCGGMYDGNFSLRAAQAGGKKHTLLQS
ncbi:MAG: hypothetical protein K2M52_02455, partial [Paramuribaculum sp.]|nr:hypothetical protein [Paramuribaculum sp.]